MKETTNVMGYGSFFLVSETIILREYIKDLIFIVLGLKGVSPLNWMILWIAPTFNPSIML